MKPIEKISVVGLGTMGTQIAIQAAAYGYAVCGFDPEPSAFAKIGRASCRERVYHPV